MRASGAGFSLRGLVRANTKIHRLKPVPLTPMEEIRRLRHDCAMENVEPKKNFAGLRVLSLESRRGPEMAKLIANHGGEATVAPSMREIPLETNTEALAFGRKLFAGEFDMVIFLTGVGTRALARVVETIYPLDQYLAELRKIAVVARGPKPVAVLKEWNVPIAVTAPEPNTWRELLRALDENAAALPLKGRRIAVQEYGVSKPGADRGPRCARRASHFRSCLRMGFACGHRPAALRDCRDCAQ